MARQTGSCQLQNGRTWGRGVFSWYTLVCNYLKGAKKKDEQQGHGHQRLIVHGELEGRPIWSHSQHKLLKKVNALPAEGNTFLYVSCFVFLSSKLSKISLFYNKQHRI